MGIINNFIMKEIYSIDDFIENKCILLNDSTVDNLKRVLIAAFGSVKFGFDHDSKKLFFKSYGRKSGYLALNTYDYYDQPIQGVSEFIKELDGIPKYSDIVLVSNDGVNWTERVFIEYIKGATNGVICVAEQTEEMFYRKGCFDIENWKYFRIKPNDDNIIEITMDEIREKFKIKPYKKLSIIDKAK